MLMRQDDLVALVQRAFALGPPNGWLLGWSPDRYYAEFARVAADAAPQNATTFDYAFCNHFEARIDGLPHEQYAILTVLLSYVADVYALHWTVYEKSGRTGRVVEAAPNTKAKCLQARVEEWIADLGFAGVPDAWLALELVGIELELSGTEHVTMSKCLFKDYEG
jgi:hypothetical protein